MTKRPVAAVLMFALALTGAASALAADVSGKWKSEFQTADGQKVQNVFTFKVDGEKLTGTVYSSLANADAKIEEGQVKGDAISFAITRNLGGSDARFQYKGKVAGDEIKFAVTIGGPDGMQVEMTAKREKQ
jgi:autotransporter translocation and assembly factor TamB